MSLAVRNQPTTSGRKDLTLKAGQPEASVTSSPGVPNAAVVSGLQKILTLEARFRAAASPEELGYLAANDIRRMTGARQSFLLKSDGREKFKINAVSSVAVVEQDAPLNRWIERLVREMLKTNQPSEVVEFALPAYCEDDCEEVRTYPFKYFVWQPMQLSDGSVFAGLLQARERPFGASDKQLSARLAAAVAHSWRALESDYRLHPGRKKRGVLWGVAISTLFLAGAIPVPMSTIAPIEIAARQPFVIAAPIDGVIDSVNKNPNTRVVKGETLFRYEDTTLRNKALLAERELGVAGAALHKTKQAAFFSEEARYQLAISKAEYALKKAEMIYAKKLLSKTEVSAPVSGLAIYAEKSGLEGRPVITGEEIMQIADPEKVAIKIALPVADAIVLQEKARVRVFLDADPLRTLEGRIVSGSYHAEPQPSGQLAYMLTAEFTDELEETPRIGAHGTAQIIGGETTLAFFLLRRPIAALRQTFGF